MPSEGKGAYDGEGKGEVGIVQAVAEYVYGCDDFGDTFEAWVDEHCAEYDLEAPAGEHRLRYTELHTQYQALFERHVEDFIACRGCTVLDFYGALRAATEDDPDSEEAQFAQILGHLVDYDVFIRVMREAAIASAGRGRRSGGEGKAAGALK